MREYKILVACASGMATSHLILDQLRDMCVEKGIPASITATKVGDLGTDPQCDVIVTSTLLNGDFKVPVVRAISFLTGIGMEEDFQKIVDILQKAE